MTKCDARCALTRYEVVTAKRENIRESIPGVSRFRTDEDAGADDDGGWVQDPHIQELLLKQTDNARAAAREKAKLDQLEIDTVTPLYEGCRSEDTRLKVTLMDLEMKVKHRMTVA